MNSQTIQSSGYSPHYGKYYFTPEGNKVLASTYGNGKFSAMNDIVYRKNSASSRFARSTAWAKFRIFYAIFFITHFVALFSVDTKVVIPSFMMGMLSLTFFYFLYYSKKKNDYIATYSQAAVDITEIKDIRSN